MKNTSFGLISCVVAVLVWIGSCAGLVAVLQNQLYFFKEPSGIRSMEVGLTISLGMALLGAGMAIGGLLQVDKKKAFSIFGLIFNGLVLLAGMGVFFLARG
jgi:hypothetical protein